MKGVKYILLFFVLLGAMDVVAQSGGVHVPNKNKREPINQKDAKGRRTGTWLLSVKAQKGEPAYNEFGTYDQGKKTGKWYKVDKEGQLMAIENYYDDMLNGEVKYYENGKLTCIGHYRSVNPAYPYDTVIVTDPVTGRESLRYAPTDHGSLKHGMWDFYDPETGKLVKEEEYQVDDLIYEKDFSSDSKADSLKYVNKMNDFIKHQNANPPQPPKKFSEERF